MRNKFLWVAVAAMAVFFAGLEYAKAGMLGSPLGLRSAIERIKLDQPSLVPMSYTQFWLKYVDDFYPQSTAFGTGFARLSDEALGEINNTINTAPERNELGQANDV